MTKTKFILSAALAVVSSQADLLAQTTPGPQPSICLRSCWGARAGSCTTLGGTLNRAIIHHTAGPSDYTSDYATAQARMRGNQNYHMDSNGWCDLGYHFLVSAGGHIFEGRAGSMGSSWKRGAHDGCNANSMGFTALGYFHTPYNHAYTATIQNAISAVIAWRMPSGWSASGSGTYCGNSVGTLDGHYKVKATACPGTIIINALGATRSNVAGRRTPSGGTKTARDVDNASASFVGTWAVSTGSTQKYGADYRYKSTAPTSEPATFSTALNTGATWNVRAWWTDGANRSASAPYIVAHDAGTTTVHKNQQSGGGAWQLLGSWNMSGTKTVQLSCWAATGFVVVADAVRWD